MRWTWPAIIALFVVAANFPALGGFVDLNPLNGYAGLSVSRSGGLLPGEPTMDINVGLTSQALGHRAALDWLHGNVPWWNPYEGVGTPLAGEMQSAAFFPPTLLLAFSNGQLFFRMLLELVAGLAMFFLAKRLALSSFVSGIAGVLFALNGTFAWYEHAAINPVCLLPVCLLGVEIARRRPLGDWRNLVLPLGLALSIVAGFPETAYLDGGLVAAWALVRSWQAGPSALDRLRLAGRLALLGAGGVALTAPLVLAFSSYVSNGSVGPHVSMAHVHLPTANLVTLALPYLTGPLKAFGAQGNAALSPLFIANSGYFGAGVLVLALLGLFAVPIRREGALRLLLLAWLATWLLRLYGVVVLEKLVADLPELRDAAVFRAAFPSMELAAVLLAAFGLEATLGTLRSAGRLGRLRPALAAAAVAGLLVGLALGPGKPLLDTVLHDKGHAAPYMTAAAIWGGVVLVVVAGAGLARRPAPAGLLLGGVLVLDALASFIYPQLSATRSASLDLAPVRYLAAHLGTGRFMSVQADPRVLRANDGGPITPNYGTYFGLSSAGYFDIPDPAIFVDFVKSRLDPYAGSEFFTGGGFDRPKEAPQPIDEVAANLASFEAIGVSYLVTGSDVPVRQRIPSATLVFSDPLTDIYHLPGAAPFFWTTGHACRLEVKDEEHVTASCTRPARLVRDELDFPNWRAAVNGRAVPVMAFRPIFQSVLLPAGRSSVVFSYSPAHIGLGEAGTVAGVLVLAGPMAWRAGRRRKHRPHRKPAAAAGETR